MRKIYDLTGQQFGSLTAIKECYPRRKAANRSRQWICQCACGRYLVVRQDNLLIGHSTQCGICKSRGRSTSVFVEGGDDHGVV